jgi:hypothetical protein
MTAYEKKLKSKIAECGNTARVYILHQTPKLAADFAKAAAHMAFILKPELREVA